MLAKLNPVTPGELLLEEFLLPMGISQYRLAKEIGVPPQRIGEIVAGKRAITAGKFGRVSTGWGRRSRRAKIPCARLS
jgi:addiction module HigA family antidote